ncbi:MAG TPA: HD domain-containing protein, partial [bacterium]|nr:HD domain-containing protein [bacterium]
FYNESTGKIEGIRSIGLPEEYIKSLNIDPSETAGEKMRNYVARCFTNKKAILITDRFKEKNFNVRMKDELRIYSTQYAVAPVYGKTKTYGVITIAVQPDNEYFMTENEIVILEFVSHQIGIIIENSILNSKIEKLYKDLILTFSNLVEFRDECTAGHCSRLILYAKKIGEKLNMSVSELRELELAAALHDIGKICTPDSILNKPGKLTAEEYDEIKKHSIKGAEIVKPLSEYFNVINAIKYHHERWDGKGYPEGLKEKKIPFYARILAVIDSFDVMINYRPYKEPMTIIEAKNELKKCGGFQFDPELCGLIIDIPDEEILKIRQG